MKFINFENTASCSDVFTIKSNNFIQDTSFVVHLDRIELENVNEASFFKFYNHTRLMNPSFCGNRDCTGIYNLLFIDQDGSYFGAKKNIFGFNTRAAKNSTCVRKLEWNAQLCDDEFAVLSIFQPSGGKRGSIITPITMTFFGTDSETDGYSNEVDNEFKIPVLVRKGKQHNIHIPKTMPNKMSYKLDASSSTDWAVFRIQHTSPQTLVAVVDGVRQTPFVYDEKNPVELKDKPKNCGAHYYFF